MARKVKNDITGNRYGRLLVLKHIKEAKWKCQCDCGNIVIVKSSHLMGGSTKSCGCLKKEIQHGMAETRIYHIWENMVQRTTNPKATGYANYGGKGVHVCEEWLDFRKFMQWARYRYSDNLTIDRIDNTKGYTPDNCRWVTRAQQNLNMSRNVRISYKGQTKCMSEWASIYNINYKTLEYRIKHGWGVEKALSTPVKHVNKKNKEPML